jgi:hypothetical protein
MGEVNALGPARVGAHGGQGIGEALAAIAFHGVEERAAEPAVVDMRCQFSAIQRKFSNPAVSVEDETNVGYLGEQSDQRCSVQIDGHALASEIIKNGIFISFADKRRKRRLYTSPTQTHALAACKESKRHVLIFVNFTRLMKVSGLVDIPPRED